MKANPRLSLRLARKKKTIKIYAFILRREKTNEKKNWKKKGPTKNGIKVNIKNK